MLGKLNGLLHALLRRVAQTSLPVVSFLLFYWERPPNKIGESEPHGSLYGLLHALFRRVAQDSLRVYKPIPTAR